MPAARFERKFYIVPDRLGLALGLLRQMCRPDPDYPFDLVNTLYYDTADLEQYELSAAGDFRKNKVRLRWYDDGKAETGETAVYLELKSRQGFASSKQRQRFTVSPHLLERQNIPDGVLSRAEITDTLGDFGHFPGKPLVPIIYISYRRYRFTEMFTGIRVSFDYDISASVVAAELGRHERTIKIAGGVIEVKGPSLDLPVSLRRLKFLDTDWSRFSKYGACLEVHFQEPGSVARSWPSGRAGDIL